MGSLIATLFFLLFFLLVAGLFVKFYLESNHAIGRVLKKNGVASYREYKRLARRKPLKKPQLPLSSKGTRGKG